MALDCDSSLLLSVPSVLKDKYQRPGGRRSQKDESQARSPSLQQRPLILSLSIFMSTIMSVLISEILFSS